jgi:putative ABC transport system permease protein
VSAVSSSWTLATAGARAHRGALAGTALTLAAAGAVLSVVGVLLETGLRGGAGVDGGTLVALASSYAGTALVVVVLVVAATVTLALRGRRREFALLRTVGATGQQVRAQVSREVLLVSLLAVPLGAVPGTLLATRLRPLLEDAGALSGGAGLSLSPLPALGALALVVPSALLIGRLAARETLRTPPTEAVRQATVEAPTVGRVRWVLALVTAAAGLSAAGTPLFVPGTIGGATAATSAFLLIGAAALAGPRLVGWAFGRAVAAAPEGTGPATRLALLNARGFSRRLTTVVVPLALALGTGTVQTSVDRAVAEAASQQLRAAVGSRYVVTGPDAAAAATADGVTGAVALGDVPVEVRTDPDSGPDALVYESTALRTVPASAPRSLFDPGVTEGSLKALADDGTIAVSEDAAFGTGLGLGDRLEVRVDGASHELRVVAVYDRGLGVGDYLTTPATAAGLGATVQATTVLVDSTDRAALAGEGRTVATPGEYVAHATSATAAQQHLSSVLLLLLLVFVGLGAANALVLTTAGRRDELALLHRTGTTRAQLRRMVTVEAVVTGLLAWLVGTLAVLPAVLGVSGGLLGWGLPAFDARAYAALSGAVVAIALGATLGPALWLGRTRRPAPVGTPVTAAAGARSR